ncbi:Uu.00g111580.m01.CDS01 [Anthostomella pinea]|uniref:Uu.00g111580.m01.CDS01 n=1 Tax=Anthostomella pinea TaxID=933095 RepID=A0AAI8YGA2_9PEZI|nr:Uu.00g111580.m01.CDS01 [Anthostomella pinea]
MTNIPPGPEQVAFFATGGLAGLSVLPIELYSTLAAQTRPASLLPFLRSHALIQVPRAGFRFWTFDIARNQLNAIQPSRRSQLRTTLTGGLSGFCGGLAEVTYQSLAFQRRLPALSALANQSCKLFFCFGTYTGLSTRLSEELPPRPFWRFWLMGSVAGGVGSGIVGAVEGARGRTLLRATGKGALSIGTVIAVQVTSCAQVLRPRSLDS